jgi:hypothetical protein
VNSEELEISLRTEFENYLKDALADMRQEVSQLQEKVETELDKHKAQLDVVFQNAFNLLNNEKGIDAGFKESVVEHLRLAKDEGARITATAMAEAEKLDDGKVIVKDNSEEVARKFRDAVNEISSKTSQAEILKSLVRHAEDFAPRGAFFIIKNEHFVGWRTFGKDKPETDDVIREIFFSVSNESILGDSVRKNSSQLSTFPKGEDAELYLDKIGYENPINQVAIPLVVRGRGVAALYADGATVNVEALETLVRIAGLTVELLASSRGSVAKQPAVAAPLVAEKPAEVKEFETETPEVYKPIEVAETYKPIETEEVYKPVEEVETYNPVEIESTSYVPVETFEPTKEVDFSHNEESFVADDSIETVSHAPVIEQTNNAFETESWGKPKGGFDDFASGFESNTTAPAFESNTTVPANDFEVTPVPSFKTEDYSFDTKPETYDFDSPKVAEYQFETPKVEAFEDFSTTPSFAKEEFEPFPKAEPVVEKESESTPLEKIADFSNYNFDIPAVLPSAISTPIEPVVEGVSTPAKPRFSDRNVDLPIDVAEDERRLHNDARRFARLLVSEIKLYNEQKVKEGRESNDLYDRLKEAIDRSREMYDKRVQPPVAAKFDYFHYEIVNTLAEGEEAKLGSVYPGATV